MTYSLSASDAVKLCDLVNMAYNRAFKVKEELTDHNEFEAYRYNHDVIEALARSYAFLPTVKGG